LFIICYSWFFIYYSFVRQLRALRLPLVGITPFPLPCFASLKLSQVRINFSPGAAKDGGQRAPEEQEQARAPSSRARGAASL
jgi:hypothetical protein